MNRIHAKGDTKQFLALSSTRMKFHSAETTSSLRLYLWTRLARKKSVIIQDPLKSWRDTFLKGKIMCEVATWNASLRRSLPTLEKPKTTYQYLQRADTAHFQSNRQIVPGLRSRWIANHPARMEFSNFPLSEFSSTLHFISRVFGIPPRPSQ